MFVYNMVKKGCRLIVLQAENQHYLSEDSFDIHFYIYLINSSYISEMQTKSSTVPNNGFHRKRDLLDVI